MVLRVISPAFGGSVAARCADYARATPSASTTSVPPAARGREPRGAVGRRLASVRTLPGAPGERQGYALGHPRGQAGRDPLGSSYAGVLARLAVGRLPRRRNDTLSPLEHTAAPATGEATCFAAGPGAVGQDQVQGLAAPRGSGHGRRRTPHRAGPAGQCPAGAHEQRVPWTSRCPASSGLHAAHVILSRLDRSRLAGWAPGVTGSAGEHGRLAGCCQGREQRGALGTISPHTGVRARRRTRTGVPDAAEPGEPLVVAGARRLAAQRTGVLRAGRRGHPWPGAWPRCGRRRGRRTSSSSCGITRMEVTGWVGTTRCASTCSARTSLHTARWEAPHHRAGGRAQRHPGGRARRIRCSTTRGCPSSWTPGGRGTGAGRRSRTSGRAARSRRGRARRCGRTATRCSAGSARCRDQRPARRGARTREQRVAGGETGGEDHDRRRGTSAGWTARPPHRGCRGAGM
ncbi:hypothetical protein QJS66_07920 [Kocuria rhizophila]|nr:hypothetical protein QJS66_07920 [Kocuria rhizophila]